MSVDLSAEPADLAQGRARWRTAVAGVLAKSAKRDAGDAAAFGPEPEQMLETPTYEAVAIRALYTALDELPEPPLPGEWPFVRGADAVRDVKSGWKVAVTTSVRCACQSVTHLLMWPLRTRFTMSSGAF